MKIWFLISGFIVSLSCVALFLWWRWEVPLLSPLSVNQVFHFLSTPPVAVSSGKVVYGFVPYWNLNKTKLRAELTHLSYFSLTIGPDGRLDGDSSPDSEVGFQRLQSESFFDLANTMTLSKRQVELVVSQFGNQDIEAFLGSPAAQDTFLSSLDAVLLAYPFSGVNLDIEYSGNVTPQLRQQLVAFVKKTNQHIDSRYDHIQLSIDMYASAPTKMQIWDVAAIGQEVDYIVIMAYDFHRRSSPQAGPVAPLFGGQDLWDSDISQQLQAYLKLVPSQKLLLGVPFYGYQWQTDSSDPQANTYPETGSTASFSRVQELLTQKNELQVEEKWNEAALSPYLIYKEGKATYLVYYENSRSLSYKLDFVNQLDMGGIAIWALGYEGDYNELWDVIKEKLDAPL